MGHGNHFESIDTDSMSLGMERIATQVGYVQQHGGLQTAIVSQLIETIRHIHKMVYTYPLSMTA